MPRTFTDLGPAQQRFMRRALHEGVPLDDPLATQLVKRNPERVTRAQALEARGLIHQRESKKGRRSWRCTDVGRGLVMAHVPVFLQARVSAQARVPVVHAEAVAGDARRARGHGRVAESMTCWFPWPRLGNAHSGKPAAMQDMVEQVSPGPYVELFARRDRLGWDTWGDESLQTAEMPAA
jgi:hypothetical protein